MGPFLRKKDRRRGGGERKGKSLLREAHVSDFIKRRKVKGRDQEMNEKEGFEVNMIKLKYYK